MIDEERADVLARATRRLREEQDAALAGASLGDLPAVGDPTWSRIASDVRRARRRTRIIVMAIALHVAVGLGGVGFAAVTGRLAALVRRPSVPTSDAEPNARARRATRPASSRVAAPAAPATGDPAIPAPPSLQPEPPAAVSPPAAPAVRAPAVHDRRLARLAVAPAPAAPAPAVPGVSAGAPAIDGLYREAHRLHFARRDFAAALGAWDRFLAAGSGPLVIEARYNRAIALAHLGRRGEAISALKPFADGEAGAYRQREARALIDRFSSEE